MECMTVNKRTFWYAHYNDNVELQDGSGNYTGERGVVYERPVEERANISAARGETEIRQFGDDLSYDKTIVMDNFNAQIDEFTVLWVDVVPVLTSMGELALKTDGNPVTPHDYIVKKVGTSLNSTMIAISKVKIG